MIRELFETDNTTGFMFLRLSLAVVMFAHGAQKALGLFGGPGLDKTIEMFTSQYHFPMIVPLFVIAAEFLGSIGLVIGLLTRVAALAIAVDIGVCAVLNHIQNGFFMNWFGNQMAEGYEYHILVLGICLALMIKGAGALSVDRLLSREQ